MNVLNCINADPSKVAVNNDLSSVSKNPNKLDAAVLNEAFSSGE
ncbi:MAG: hypothetical protein SPJ27_05720 [Candidatus Onthovivens sp.]|nr:hypothetical protein [Candidatus Onthovivens sp.]